MPWQDHDYRSAEELKNILDSRLEGEDDEIFREVDISGMNFSREVVFGPDSPTNQTTVILWGHYAEGSTSPSDGVGFIQHELEEIEYIIEGEGTLLYGDEDGEEVVAEYDVGPGDFFGHEAYQSHKLITNEAPLIGIAVHPTANDYKSRSVGSHEY